jgi:RNA polymerase sigma-70 factor (ECF subfamily)
VEGKDRVLTGARMMTSRRAVGDSVEGRSAEAGDDAERAATFRQLAERHLSDSYRRANAILGDPSESKDAVHDAFLTAWRKWHSLRDHGKFEQWFQRIVVNTCRNRLKRASRLTTDGGRLAGTLPAADAIGPIHDRMRIETALARMKPDDQVVLALRFYRDLKVDDIASLLGIPSGTVMSRLHNAQRRLRTLIDESDAQGDQR